MPLKLATGWSRDAAEISTRVEPGIPAWVQLGEKQGWGRGRWGGPRLLSPCSLPVSAGTK